MNGCADGYNPLRWDCDRRGCFNKKKRPKIEMLARYLPGRIAFSDVDATVEINGHQLSIEWKPAAVELAMGQRIMFSRITASGMHDVIVVAGDAETMEVLSMAYFSRGKWFDWRGASLADVGAAIERWVGMVQSAPRVTAVPMVTP